MVLFRVLVTNDLFARRESALAVGGILGCSGLSGQRLCVWPFYGWEVAGIFILETLQQDTVHRRLGRAG